MYMNVFIVMCVTLVCLTISEAGVTGEDKRFIYNSQYTWATWQSYGPCNCGVGTKSRHRLCDEIDKDTGARQQTGINNCNGYSTMFVTCSCTGGNCSDAISSCSSFDKTVCQQPYLDWAKNNCNKYCGFCDNGHTSGHTTGQCHDSFDSCSSYGKYVCQQYVPWSQKNCQKYCGYCNEVPIIPVNGGWSTWSSPSTCSVTCGQGYQRSTRTCLKPALAYGGQGCAGSPTQNFVCYNLPCATAAPAIDGHWSPWSKYGSCSHTCGGGTHIRYRYCNNPTPSGGGSKCSGTAYEQDKCNTQICIVNGGWSGWSTWTSCSKPCDLGTITRQRACNQPTPSRGGAPCSGSHTETHECSMGPCPEWSYWYQSDCSVTCGNGTMDRLRHCSTGRDSDCTGMATELVPCMEVSCID